MNNKKILFLVPILTFLAAGCGSSKPADNNNPPATEQTNNAPANNSPIGTNSSSKETTSPSGSVWQATLQKSDNTTSGNYMISVDGHKVYLNTSRDYSALVNKQVNVNYTGSVTGFTLNDITAQ